MDDRTSELFGRVHALEFLMKQLLFEGLKDGRRGLFVSKALEACENHLHDQIAMLEGDEKRIAQHALQSTKEFISGLMLDLYDKPDKPS